MQNNGVHLSGNPGSARYWQPKHLWVRCLIKQTGFTWCAHIQRNLNKKLRSVVSDKSATKIWLKSKIKSLVSNMRDCKSEFPQGVAQARRFCHILSRGPETNLVCFRKVYSAHFAWSMLPSLPLKLVAGPTNQRTKKFLKCHLRKEAHDRMHL